MEISQIINVNVYTWYCHRFEHDAGFLSWRQRRVNAVTWNSARLFIWIGCWVGLLAKQVVGDIGVFCLTVTEKTQLARKNDFLFWIQLEKHPLLRPILKYLNLEASLQSLLSFACTFTYSLAQQINCDKILFSHTRRWYQFQFSFISLFFVIFFYYFMLIYVILLLLIFIKIILLLLFYSIFFRRNVPFTRKVRVLCKTRLIFPRINGPIVSIERCFS